MSSFPPTFLPVPGFSRTGDGDETGRYVEQWLTLLKRSPHWSAYVEVHCIVVLAIGASPLQTLQDVKKEVEADVAKPVTR